MQQVHFGEGKDGDVGSLSEQGRTATLSAVSPKTDRDVGRYAAQDAFARNFAKAQTRTPLCQIKPTR